MYHATLLSQWKIATGLTIQSELGDQGSGAFKCGISDGVGTELVTRTESQT